MKLAGKVLVVTGAGAGAGSGIGRAVALEPCAALGESLPSAHLIADKMKDLLGR